MKKVDFSKVELTKAQQKNLKEVSLTIQEVAKNLFIKAINKKYAQGASVDVIRKYTKVIERLTGNCEFEDEEFKFLKDAYDNLEFPLSDFVPTISDFLSTVK